MRSSCNVAALTRRTLLYLGVRPVESTTLQGSKLYPARNIVNLYNKYSVLIDWYISNNQIILDFEICIYNILIQ